MTKTTLENIKRLLFGIMPKANKLSSIEEMRSFYYKFLEGNLMFIDADEEIDINAPEIAELITNDFILIETDEPKVFEADGYVPWLNDARKDISWTYYNRYEQYLLQKKGWKPTAIASIQTSSDIILDHMANPRTKNLFDKRGLVIGDIQSGKTANYTAVINKAIDAGYKIVIVLAGMTRDLRNQTQNRLDAEVLGYETRSSGKGNAMGVGCLKQLSIEGLTYSDEKKDYGDMKKYFSSHTLNESLNPIVAIVKKNKSVLKHLHKFLMSSQSSCYTNGKLDIPVLIIDDEVDQASVDTKNSDTIEDASAINGMIRTILDGLNRYSYVGYTATPFANVFINPDREDIYPKDFILTIPSNDGYCGVQEYFGVNIFDEEDCTSDSITDLVVNINDYGDLFDKNPKINAQTTTAALNESIKDAILSFIIAASIKKARGFNGNNSMLIHIARFKNPSTTLKPLVKDFVSDIRYQLKYNYDSYIWTFKNMWETKFKNVSQVRLADKFRDSWDEISEFLLPTVEAALNNILVINGDSEDILDYSNSNGSDYIIIGGDKLSRGLTLEGLVVSYYYRHSKSYDSLLQMGRWFGYRKGWIDVCRVFSTVRFVNDFITVGKVLQKFKNDVDDMYKQKLNPREVGQRIMYSPNLIPTARNKMKGIEKMKVSFSGQIQQIITFDKAHVEHNLNVAREFISTLGEGEINNHKVIFRDVSVDKVLAYLKAYKECSKYYGFGHISIYNWIKYIENLVGKGELTNWTIVLHSLQKESAAIEDIAGYKVYKPIRALRDVGDSSEFDCFTIKAIADPKDFAEFFHRDSNEYKTFKTFGESKKYGFNEKNGVMAIYIVDLYEKILTDEFNPKTNKYKTKNSDLPIPNGISVSGPAIWFSETKDFEESATEYYVTKDYQKIEEEQRKNDLIEFGDDDNE